MALKGKKPEVTEQRFKALIYGDHGTGKSHFACSFPDTYYIDTEKLQEYNKFVKMLNASNSILCYMNDFHEIINEVKELLSVAHNYKTLVIDSISFPYGLLAQHEIDRLVKASSKPIEGTEFQAHLSKPKRLLFHLGMLLTRLDMNVIVIAHEKSKFQGGEEIGKTFDIGEKIGYSLGTIINLKMIGPKRFAVITKTRYDELPNKETISFDDGYKIITDRFGNEMFSREVKVEKLAEALQIEELNHLIKLLNIPDETIQKWLTSSKCMSLDELSEEVCLKLITACKKKLEIKGE